MGGGVLKFGEAVTAADATAPPTSPPVVPAPALHVIVLGSGGGPFENNVTGFLVRSIESGWAEGSVVAVDAGVHLSAIEKILEQTQPKTLGQPGGPALPHTLATGPFAGLEVPNATAAANASYIHRTLVDTYLITHPHLDHIAGLVINTAGLGGYRPKRVAGLPSTITALKTHIFNNVIWPNLSDENNGAGLVTYMRLVEGGSPVFGQGEGRGYVEMCRGLAVKVLGVSHGHCMERHSHRGSSSTRHGSFDASSLPPPNMPSPSRNVATHTSLPTNIGAILQQHEHLQALPGGRRGSSFSAGQAVDETICVSDSSVYFIRNKTTGREILMFGDVEPDSVSLSPRTRQVWEAAAPKITAGNLAAIFIECSYDDSRPVERLYGHLTPKYLREEMTALAEEVVAARQEKERSSSNYGLSGGDKKRKRVSVDGSLAKRKSTPQLASSRDPGSDVPVSPRSLTPRRRVNSAASSVSDQPSSQDIPKTLPLPTHPLRSTTTAEAPGARQTPDDAPVPSQDQQYFDMTPNTSDLSPTAATTPLTIPTSHPQLFPLQQKSQQQLPLQQQSSSSSEIRDALKGLKVVVIHVKDRMADGTQAGEDILRELVEHERVAQLGVEYLVSAAGQEYFF